MTTHRTTSLLALPLLIGLGALSSAPARTELDLTPRFKEGQSLTITQSFTMDGALDQLSVLVDGAEVLGDGIGMDIEAEGNAAYTESILELRDGAIAKMRITVDEQGGEMTGAVDAMGSTESLDETYDSDLVGRTIEIVVDEEGETSVTDVTEAATSEADETELNAMTHENHFEELLPTEPVEEGVEFELAADWMDGARELMEAEMNSDTAGLPAEQIEMARMMVEAFFDGTSIEATGKVIDVEDGVATIDYELAAIMSIDDLVSIISQAMPPEMGGEIPPGVEASIEANIEIEGTGKFDLNLGQMVSLELAGEYEVIFSGAAEMDGTSGEANASMSGSIGITATIEVN